ncbi:hypothetical protein J5N97_026071 [Dioscorea zingiberensis]|uniref:RING-type E3 ubiquitin transferase n=1 Tax=Dioscorea zingiberensis TaxID=325984 RepID=A0A9D5C2Q0_9LILI|nr:hypothetical protein J5N97_026071 [Dioscorea zingiberensis]
MEHTQSTSPRSDRRSPMADSRYSPSSISPPSLLLLLVFLAATAVAAATPPYSPNCGASVPESTPTTRLIHSSSHSFFTLSNGQFSGGDPFTPASSMSRFFYFLPHAFYRTTTPGVLGLTATLSFRSRGTRFLGRNLTESSLLFDRVQPRISKRRWPLSFELSGFWSESSGLLCMVGEGTSRSLDGKLLPLSAVLNLHYPKSSNITTSLVAGTISSLESADSPNHFNPISILAYSQKSYNYTMISDANASCSHVDLKEKSLGLETSDVCSSLRGFSGGRFRLEYGADCSSKNCGPFAKDPGFYPSFLSLNALQCSDDGKLHLFMGFSNYSGYGYRSMFAANNSLVAEGFWDHDKNRLCMVACRALGFEGLRNVSVADCTIRVCLWFPAVISIESRGSIVGRLWSDKDEKDSGHFDMVSFWSSDSSGMNSLSGLRYQYTKLGNLSSSCKAFSSSKSRSSKKKYPDGKSVGDMSFDLSLKDSEGRTTWGYASPIAIGENIYGHSFMVYTAASTPATPLLDLNHSLLNVSYRISYTLPNSSYDGSGQTEISAEGVYNAAAGSFCMIGCRYLLASVNEKQVKSLASKDCEVLINIQLPSLHPEAREHLDGSIRSTRKKSDPLYFEPLETRPYVMYTNQAVESIWRMDIEITMVLISLTLSCIFIGFQLFYLNKHPDVLPSISITMLVILALGHMIPLVLNFEALFLNRNRQNVLSWSGGWLEANEVIVRVITMVAFLMQFSFLQVAWSSRYREESKMGLWMAERKALQLCLPLYFIGGLIAWFVYSSPSRPLLQRLDFDSANHRSLWEDMISYAGLILDGFLLPQILLNIFWNSKDKALSPVFYVGTTIIRALPHLYDAYRARHYVPHFNSSYIYANPNGDFYSSAWDIIIPCEGVLFAVLIFLQQRFGGTCFLPARFRQSTGYETVSSISL